MKFYKAFLFPTLLACLSLSSCYHEFSTTTCGASCNNNGNTFLNLVIASTPSSTFFFPSLTWPIGNISLIDSAGTPTSLGGSGGVAFVDFTRLQTDSLYLGHTTVAATSYKTLQVQLSTPLFSYFFNHTNATLLGCTPGATCLIPTTVPGFGATTINIPITYSTTANSNAGIRVNFDLNKAVTSAAGMTFDFTQPGAITVIPDPPTSSSQTSGLDTVDNFTGVVTATTATTVTVSSFASEARTFTLASTVLFDPFAICPVPASSTCLAAGQNVSIDGVLNSDGTMTAGEIEFLDPAPAVNELEGVITSPVTNNQFKMVLTNGMGSNVLIVSSPVIVNINGAEAYSIDPKNLGLSPTGNLGFESQTDLVLGQTVMVRGGTFSGNNTSITNPTRVLLRYSSISGLVQAPSGTIFSLGSVSPFYANLVNNSVQTQTFTTTAYDNISGFSGLVGGTTNASVRGLYLNPTSGATQPLLAAKVRSH